MAQRLNADVPIGNILFNTAMLLIAWKETGRYFNIDIVFEIQSKQN